MHASYKDITKHDVQAQTLAGKGRTTASVAARAAAEASRVECPVMPHRSLTMLPMPAIPGTRYDSVKDQRAQSPKHSLSGTATLCLALRHIKPPGELALSSPESLGSANGLQNKEHL